LAIAPKRGEKMGERENSQGPVGQCSPVREGGTQDGVKGTGDGMEKERMKDKLGGFVFD